VGEIEKNHLCSIIFFVENRAICEIMWKNILRFGKVADDNTMHEHCIVDT